MPSHASVSQDCFFPSRIRASLAESMIYLILVEMIFSIKIKMYRFDRQNNSCPIVSYLSPPDGCTHGWWWWWVGETIPTVM